MYLKHCSSVTVYRWGQHFVNFENLSTASFPCAFQNISIFFSASLSSLRHRFSNSFLSVLMLLIPFFNKYKFGISYFFHQFIIPSDYVTLPLDYTRYTSVDSPSPNTRLIIKNLLSSNTFLHHNMHYAYSSNNFHRNYFPYSVHSIAFFALFNVISIFT